MLNADVISFFAASKFQKIKKMAKRAKIEEENLHRKILTKATKNQSCNLSLENRISELISILILELILGLTLKKLGEDQFDTLRFFPNYAF